MTHYITPLKRQPEHLQDGTIRVFLTKGKVSIIDDIDAELSQFNWTVYNGYAGVGLTIKGKRVSYKLHNAIMERLLNRPLNSGEEVDHIDLDRLNNRRCNLRVCTRSENLRNKRKSRNNTSGYKGVVYRKPDKHHKTEKWDAVIMIGGKAKHIGCFSTPEQAHIAYCEVGKEMFGNFFNPG